MHVIDIDAEYEPGIWKLSTYPSRGGESFLRPIHQLTIHHRHISEFDSIDDMITNSDRRYLDPDTSISEELIYEILSSGKY